MGRRSDLVIERLSGLQLGHSVEFSLQTIFGWVLSEMAWIIGVQCHDANLVSSFIGQEVVINELVAMSTCPNTWIR